MATFSRFSLLAIFTLSLLIATSSARPCKTLFYFSTTTLNPDFHSIPANPNFPNTFTHKPRYFTLVFINPNPTVDHESQLPNLRINSENGYSVKERTMDVMSVIGALLFGIGCGALTASIMYFIWAIFSGNRDVDFDVVADEDSEDGDDFEDEAVAAKKKGFEYVKVDGDEKTEEAV